MHKIIFFVAYRCKYCQLRIKNRIFFSSFSINSFYILNKKNSVVSLSICCQYIAILGQVINNNTVCPAKSSLHIIFAASTNSAKSLSRILKIFNKKNPISSFIHFHKCSLAYKRNCLSPFHTCIRFY